MPKVKKYKLDVKRDVDPVGDDGFMLWLPFGWRFYDEIVHVRGYDTMKELREDVRSGWMIIPCDCDECTQAIADGKGV